MGTATFSISKYGIQRGTGAGTVTGAFVASGAHTTSTSPTNLTDGAAGAGSAITAVKGDVLYIQVDEDARLVAGGGTATATNGHILFAGTPRDIEIAESGTVSIVDVA